MLSSSANTVPAWLTVRHMEEIDGTTDERSEIADERRVTSHAQPPGRRIGVEAAAELTALRHVGGKARTAPVN